MEDLKITIENKKVEKREKIKDVAIKTIMGKVNNHKTWTDFTIT